MKLGMQRAVPVATERFHDALDELENEVRLAQTVLRRDLALLKENRKKRDAAAKQHEAERARQAAEAKNAPALKPDPPVKIEKVATPHSPAPSTPEPEQAAPQTEAEEGQKREEESAPPPIKTDNEDEPPRDPLFDGTPTTANPHESEFDFEAMFGDSAMDTGDDDNNQDTVMDISGDMDFNLEDSNDGPSLLRGLEDFAKSGDDSNTPQDTNMDPDLPMPDLPDLHTAAETQPEPAPEPEPKKESPPEAETPKAAAPPANDATNSTATETKVEEPTTENDMMTTMAVDDLEDLFNMDEYENPENSSFDDAFFNFE
jgi:hypothetical protein